MKNHGRAAILLPHGVLFRGNAEQTIRRNLIETQNLVDAVIGLPANCFYGTGIAVCLLVLRKDRNGDSKNICFIDASKYFTKVGNKNTITEDDINRICKAYTDRVDIEHYCSIVDISKIAENDFNLNIPLYVEAEKEVVEHDLSALFKEYAELEKKSEALKACINKQLEGFGIKERFEVYLEEADISKEVAATSSNEEETSSNEEETSSFEEETKREDLGETYDF
jgi:type I restriction enzyme M protein